MPMASKRAAVRQTKRPKPTEGKHRWPLTTPHSRHGRTDVDRHARSDAGRVPRRVRRAGKVLVGTASWTDPGFIEDWYPPKLPARERLAWYAEHFNLVEVNSSFYAIPSQTVVANWAEQTPPGFVFDLKLPRLLSRHSTPLATLPRGLRPMAQER